MNFGDGTWRERHRYALLFWRGHRARSPRSRRKQFVIDNPGALELTNMRAKTEEMVPCNHRGQVACWSCGEEVERPTVLRKRAMDAEADRDRAVALLRALNPRSRFPMNPTLNAIREAADLNAIDRRTRVVAASVRRP